MRCPPQIWYGVQGEGRGHATRSKVLIDALREEGCRVRIFSGGDALDVFGNDPDLEEIPLLRFSFERGGRLHLLATLARNLRPMRELLRDDGETCTRLRQLAARHRPDLVVSDFEPLVGRLATRAKIPWASVDHQHVLTDTILPRLGPMRGLEIALLARCTRWLVPAPVRVVSSFHHFPAKPGSKTVLVGCFLREGLRRTAARDDGHVCVYLKEHSLLEDLLPVLAATPMTRFHVWCRGAAHAPENVSLREPHPEAFLDDLASCSWLLSTAGNQLLGEALALGKPVLAFPVPGQTEQILNAVALGRSGCGRSTELRRLNPGLLGAFSAELAGFHQACRLRSRNESLLEPVDATLEAILPGLRQRRTAAA